MRAVEIAALRKRGYNNSTNASAELRVKETYSKIGGTYSLFHKPFRLTHSHSTGRIVKPFHAALGSKTPRGRGDGIIRAAGANQPVGIGQYPPLSETLFVLRVPQVKCMTHKHTHPQKTSMKQQNEPEKIRQTESKFDACKSNIMGVAAMSRTNIIQEELSEKTQMPRQVEMHRHTHAAWR